MRRWLGILAIMVGLLSALPVGVLADQSYTVCPTFSDFKRDVEAVSGGATFTLPADCTLNATDTIKIQSGASVTINGNGLTLDGQQNTSLDLISIPWSTNPGSLTLDHATLQNAKNGIMDLYEIATIGVTNSTITGNTGYGIYAGNVMVSDSTVSNNGTGGILVGKVGSVRDSQISHNTEYGINSRITAALTVADSEINNSVQGIVAGKSLEVSGSTLSDNSWHGIRGFTKTMALTVIDSTITRNGLTGINSNGNVTVTGGSISGNVGGGIASGGTVAVTNGTVSNNGYEGISANIANVTTSTVSNNSYDGVITSTAATVTNSTVSGNGFGQSGRGGINGQSGSATATSSTLVGNRNHGIGGGTITLASTLLAGNQGANCGNWRGSDLGYNLSTDISCFFGSANHSRNDVPIDDLHLGTLGDHGGPAETIPLLANSVAIDAIPVDGDNHCLNAGGQPITDPVTSTPIAIDQRGIERPQGPGCDIGAYEFQAEVAKQDQTITFDTLADKTYGDAPFTVSATASSNLPVSFSASPSSVCTASGTDGSTITIVGMGTCTVTASQVGNDDYNPASDREQVFDVGPASLTITADNQTMIYGGQVPNYTAGYGGFVNGDTEGVVSGLTCGAVDANDDAVTSSTPVGSYTINCSGASAGNYAITYVNGTLTIKNASLMIAASDGSITYGDPVPTITPSYSGFLGDDNASNALTTPPTCSTTVTSSSPPGTYPTTCSGAVASNYDISYVAGTLTITQATATITSDPANADPKLVGGGGTADFTLKATLQASAGDISTTLPVTYTLTPAGSDTPSTCTDSTGNGVTNGVLQSSCAFTGIAPGDYTLTISVNSSTYSGTTTDSVTVYKGTVIITASSPTIAYGDPIPAITPSYTGFVGSDTAATALSTLPTCDTTATGASLPDSYPTRCSGAASSTYAITYADGTLTIKNAPLTITASGAAITYGDPIPAITPSYAGFVHGDTADTALSTLPTCSTTATSSSQPGTYSTTCFGAISDHYDITYVAGILTINNGICALYDQAKANQSGSAIPIKIQLCDADGKDISSLNVTVHAVSVARVPDGTPQPVQAKGNANPGNDFRFDRTLGPAGGYIYNLDTKGLTSGTYILNFSVAGDPQPHSVQFAIR